jgi:hypothetical protein
VGYKSKFEPAPFGNEATSSISGDMTVSGDLCVGGSICVTDTFSIVSASYYIGDGSGLTGVTASMSGCWQPAGGGDIYFDTGNAALGKNSPDAGIIFDVVGNVHVAGDITVTGSTEFGNTLDTTHVFSGSLTVASGNQGYIDGYKRYRCAYLLPRDTKFSGDGGNFVQYVTSSGDDNNDGVTWDTALKTLGKAIERTPTVEGILEGNKSVIWLGTGSFGAAGSFQRLSGVRIQGSFHNLDSGSITPISGGAGTPNYVTGLILDVSLAGTYTADQLRGSMWSEASGYGDLANQSSNDNGIKRGVIYRNDATDAGLTRIYTTHQAGSGVDLSAATCYLRGYDSKLDWKLDQIMSASTGIEQIVFNEFLEFENLHFSSSTDTTSITQYAMQNNRLNINSCIFDDDKFRGLVTTQGRTWMTTCYYAPAHHISQDPLGVRYGGDLLLRSCVFDGKRGSPDPGTFMDIVANADGNLTFDRENVFRQWGGIYCENGNIVAPVQADHPFPILFDSSSADGDHICDIGIVANMDPSQMSYGPTAGGQLQLPHLHGTVASDYAVVLKSGARAIWATNEPSTITSSLGINKVSADGGISECSQDRFLTMISGVATPLQADGYARYNYGSYRPFLGEDTGSTGLGYGAQPGEYFAFYVNSSSGDDRYDGLTEATAFRTLHKALERCPMGVNISYLDGSQQTIQIYVASGNYDFPTSLEGASNVLFAGTTSSADAITTDWVVVSASRADGSIIDATFSNTYDEDELRGRFIDVDASQTEHSVTKYAWIYANESSSAGATRLYIANSNGPENLPADKSHLLLLNQDTRFIIPEEPGSTSPTAMVNFGAELSFKNIHFDASGTTSPANGQLYNNANNKVAYRGCKFGGADTKLKTVFVAQGRANIETCYFDLDQGLTAGTNGAIWSKFSNVFDGCSFSIAKTGIANLQDTLGENVFRDSSAGLQMHGHKLQASGGMCRFLEFTGTVGCTNGVRANFQKNDGGGFYVLPELYGAISAEYAAKSEKGATMYFDPLSNLSSSLGINKVSADGGLTECAQTNFLTMISGGALNATGFVQYATGSTILGSASSDIHQVTGSWHMSGTSASFDVNEFKISLYSTEGPDHPFAIPNAMVMRTHPKFEGRSPQVCFGVDEPPYVGSNSTYIFAENMDTADLPPSGGGHDFYEADMAFWFSGSAASALTGEFVNTFHMLRWNGGQVGAFQGLVGADLNNTRLTCSWAPGNSMWNYSARIRAKNDLHFGAGDPGPYDTTGSGQTTYGQLSQTSSMILFKEGGLFIGRPADGSRTQTPVGGLLVSGSAILSSSVNFAGYQAAGTSITASVDAAIIGCTATGITITLDDPSLSSTGRVLIIKDETGTAGSTPITISASIGTIDGGTTQDLDENHEAVSIYSNGSNWFIY